MSDKNSDNGLIKDIGNSSESTVSELINSVMSCVEATASLNAGGGTITRADLIQEGLIGALNAALSFDESKGASFQTYANRCIFNSISSAVSKGSSTKQKIINGYIPLEDVGTALEGTQDDPESIVTMNENIAAIENCIDTKLTDLEKDVLLLHIADESYEQISKKLGITNKAVANALCRARQKIKEEINHNL